MAAAPLPGRPRALVLNRSDNVAVAAVVLEPGAEIDCEGGPVVVTDRIPFGHKLALRFIPSGGEVLKYGEVIGKATSDIRAGGHVHVHNVISARLPGTR